MKFTSPYVFLMRTANVVQVPSFSAILFIKAASIIPSHKELPRQLVGKRVGGRPMHFYQIWPYLPVSLEIFDL